MSQQSEEEDGRSNLSRPLFGRESGPDGEQDTGGSETPTLVPVDEGGPLGPAGQPQWRRQPPMELDAEVSKVGRFRFRGENYMATQVMAVGSVIAGGVLWLLGGWLPGLLVMLLGPLVAYVFHKTATSPHD